MKLAVAILLLSVLTCSARAELDAGLNLCGGGGPTPLLDVTLNPTIKQLPVSPGLQNFAMWENSNQIIYRGINDRLTSFHLVDGSEELLAKHMKAPVSRVVDPNERLVLASQIGRLFDTVFQIWRWLLFRAVPMEHLFWHDNVLYSVAHDFDNQGQNIFQIYKYDYDGGDHTAQKWCSAIPQDTQLDIKVAKGSSYPNVVLYKVQQTAMGYSIWVSTIDVSTAPCKMTPFTVYPQYLSSAVTDVHWFGDGAFAITLAAPSANLVWHTNNSCQIFTAGDGSAAPMVPNSGAHVLALDKGAGQLSLIYLDDQMQGTVALPTHGAGPFDQSNIWLTGDKSRLFLAPADVTGVNRSLYEADIRALP